MRNAIHVSIKSAVFAGILACTSMANAQIQKPMEFIDPVYNPNYQRMVAAYAAIGTQNYACQISNGVAKWVPTGPNAYLYYFSGSGFYYAGYHGLDDQGRPMWTLSNGSQFIANPDTKVIADAPIPTGSSKNVTIPYLRMHAAVHTGNFTSAETVYRLYTSLGQPDASKCTTATPYTYVSVPYTAFYYFMYNSAF